MIANTVFSRGQSGIDRSELVMLLLYSLPVTVLAVFCVYYIDRPISLFVQTQLYASTFWSNLTSRLPDSLLMVVIFISAGSYILYFFRKVKHLYDTKTFLLKFMAITLPVSFIGKSLSKIVFGRIETRVWLQDPQQYGFHWFYSGSHFSGFPSGHMVVFTTLAAAIWRFYPRHKKILCLSLAVLGALLIATNYHFLSDVICGTYLGLLIEALMFFIMRQQWNKNSSVHAEHIQSA